MKKRYYLYSLMAAATLLLSACSKDSNIGFDEEGEVGAIPITLGSSGYFNFTSLSTKASIEPGQNWVGNDNIGIFGLAVGSTDWTDTTLPLPNCLMNNVQGTIKEHALNGVNDSIISYTPLQYYPMSSEKRYSFYGYHPYQVAEIGKTVVTANSITTAYTIDGTQDLLWGKAEANPVNGVEGYNAKYFRQTGATVPRITFNHLLTRLQFFIVAGPKGALDDELYGDIPATSLSVTSIKVLEAKNNPTLTIAGTTEGQLSWGQGTADFTLKGYNVSTKEDIIITQQAVETVEKQIGESIMLQPGISEYKLEVKVKVTTPQGNQPTDEFTAPLILKAPDANGTFQAGVSHKVTLTVNGLKSVLVAAEVAKWKEGTGIPVEVN